MKKVVCEHCKYNWSSRSGLGQTTCPSCGKKTKNTSEEINEGEKTGTGGSTRSD